MEVNGLIENDGSDVEGEEKTRKMVMSVAQDLIYGEKQGEKMHTQTYWAN